ncbi:MAG: F0F1 ATP synthase subunit epsilon [Flavobacteriia bacterium]|nr:F0F1 ATP synthase subunit epsilon [Flavobacteriia bacterium]
MYLEVITPDNKIFAGEIEAVQLPGIDGSFQILNNHAAIISALTNGKLKVNTTNAIEKENKKWVGVEFTNDSKIIYIPITGGVVEMQQNKIIVLAE